MCRSLICLDKYARNTGNEKKPHIFMRLGADQSLNSEEQACLEHFKSGLMRTLFSLVFTMESMIEMRLPS